LPQQLSIADDTAIASIVSLVDNRRLVRVLERVTINTVVTRVQLPLYKPRIVAVFKTASVRGLEVALPREQLSCEARPERVRVFD
jgi:hypothetical protein